MEQGNPALACWFLSGPTASGKTGIGVRLAERLPAEIISLDSMSLYREMDIGTAKPTEEQRRAIPHHLLDELEPWESYSVSNFIEAAEQRIGEIRGRGREVLFVGGTPLYLKALLRGLLDGPPADWEFRRSIEEELPRAGIEALHARLQMVDPLSAERLHPHDKRRIIRALEVYHVTGKPISHLQTQFEDGPAWECGRVFVLQWPRERLHQRINDRVDAMFRDGFVDEVREIVARHGNLSRTASQAVGYREVIAYLNGESTLEDTIESVKTRTRRFARRQETWFRSLPECRFVAMQDGFDPDEVAQRILALGQGGHGC